jgi:Doubled CXXCH motif (Paired_CXXCH_1)
MPRAADLFFAVLLCLFASMALAALWRSSSRANSSASRADGSPVSQASVLPSEVHPIIIRKPSGPPRIELVGNDPQGRTGSVACSTCHAVRQANLENKSAATLDEFHQGMTFSHGSITCYACHNPNDSDALRQADGSSVNYENVMALCSQCHSKQAESFAHGAHGGMNGHWDLSRGPQIKNNCIDCHDPHVPEYPKMIVGFKPKDRFNEPPNLEHNHEGTAAHDNH